MTAFYLNKTKSLLALAALFLIAGLLFNVRLSSMLIIKYLSEDKILEEGTLVFLREFQVGLIATGSVLALLGLGNIVMGRRPFPASASPLARYLLLAIILSLGAYLIYLPPYYAMRFLNSDPSHYAVSAFNIMAGKGFTLTLNHHQYPSCFLIGYPLCIIPFYLILGPFLGNAIFTTSAFSILTLWATYACSRKLFGTTAALLTTLLLCSNWLFINLSKQVRSDTFICLLMLLSILVFITIMKKERGGYFSPFLLGLILGFSYTVRPPNLITLLVFFMAFLLHRGLRPTIKSMIILAIGMAFIMMPYMVFCNATYGGPLRTGYHIWVPERLESPGFLSPRNIVFNISPPTPHPPKNTIQKIQGILRTTNGAFYSSALLGLNKIYNPAVFIFIVIGISHSLSRGIATRADRRMLTPCVIFIIGLSVLFYMMIPCSDYRYLLPVLPLLLAFAGFGMSRKVQFSYRKRIRPASLFYLILFSIVMPGVGLSLYRRVTTPPPPPLQYEICKTYRELVPPDGCIISGMDAVLVDYFVLSGSKRVFFALSEKSMCVDQRLRLKPGDALITLPIIPVSRRMDKIYALIDKGKVVLMDDWENPLWLGWRYREDLEMMRDNFTLEEVGRKGPFHIYRLSNKNRSYRK